MKSSKLEKNWFNTEKVWNVLYNNTSWPVRKLVYYNTRNLVILSLKRMLKSQIKIMVIE